MDEASNTPQLAVVIPTIDEVETLPSLLQQLLNQQGVVLEIIVADGGSNDGTQEAARQARDVKVVQSEAGRGRQMNRAARQATAPFLLFLHADSALTTTDQLYTALCALTRRIQQRGDHRVAGHFRLKFKRSQAGRDLAYRYYEEKSALNRAECTNGDQGFLLHRGFFESLGGFDESLEFLEDQRLAETIRREGEWITLPGEVLTSARRFEREGLLRRMILSAFIMNFHAIGLTEFFRHAAILYPRQGETRRLRLAPFFQLIHDLNVNAGPSIARQRWLDTGRYVRRHAWQPFFFLDVSLQPLIGSTRRPFLWFHDHLFRAMTENRIGDYLTAALTWLWFKTAWWGFHLIEGSEKRPL